MPEALERKAIVAIGRILTKQDPNLALDRVLEISGEPDGGLLTLIGEASDTLDDAKLRRILVHKSSDLRLMAADGLACKDLLTAEEAKALLSDSEARVRAIGIRRLIALGDRLTAGNIRELLADDSKAQASDAFSVAGSGTSRATLRRLSRRTFLDTRVRRTYSVGELDFARRPYRVQSSRPQAL